MRVTAIIIGAILLIAAVRGTEKDSAPGANDGKGLWGLLKADFEPGPQGNFLAWFAAILAIGAIGYIPHLEGVSTALLAIVIIVLLLEPGKNGPQGASVLGQLADAVTKKGS